MKIRSLARVASGLWVIAFSIALYPASGGAQEEHRLGGSEVAVYNLAGSVEVLAGSGADVVVQVTRGGADAQRLEAEILRIDGREALVIRYPGDQVVYPKMGRGSRTEIRVRDDGTFFGEGGSSGARRVRISGSGSGMEAWADLRITVPRGREFALYLATGETGLEDVEGTILVDAGSGPVQARNGSGELNVDTGSGEISVEGFEGELALDTGSGSVTLRDVRGGDVRVDSGSGGIVASQVSAASLEVETGSGSMELRGIAAPEVVLDTGSGTVELELTADVDRLEIDTGSGSVDLWVPLSVGAEVELDTGSGGIDLDLPFEAQEVKRDLVRGVLGDGRGSIVVDTGSGRIRLMGR